MKKRAAAIILAAIMTITLTACRRGDGALPRGDETKDRSTSVSGLDKDDFEEDSDEDLIVIGFSQVGAESDWRAANTKSMQEAFREDSGYRLIYEDAQQKQEKQITSLRNFIQLEVDYIILAPTTETGWDTVLQEAKAVKIPVIIVDREIKVADESLFTCWIGSDFRKEGEKATEWLDENHPEEALKIVHLQGNLDSTAQLGRTASLDKALKGHANWSLAARGSGEFTQAKGQELMEEILEKETYFNVLYSENDNMTYGALDAMKEYGLNPGEDVTVISFDASRTALELVMAGEINYEVECNPLHGPRVRAVIDALEGGRTPQKFTYVEETAFEAKNTTPTLLKQREY